MFPDFQCCYLHNIKSYHPSLVCCISTVDQWEYSISEVRISELIKMRNAKIFSQSELPGASNIKRRTSMQQNNIYKNVDKAIWPRSTKKGKLDDCEIKDMLLCTWVRCGPSPLSAGKLQQLIFRSLEDIRINMDQEIKIKIKDHIVMDLSSMQA